MNKIVGAMVVGLLLIPSAAFAQTVNSDNTAQIQATLASLVAQVKVLQARLEALETASLSTSSYVSIPDHSGELSKKADLDENCVRYVHGFAQDCGGD